MQENISVILPIFNVEHYLRQAIDSVLSQTFPIFEIILVDDGATDNSGQICEEYSQKYKQIKVIHQKNAGLGAARNAGLAIATGKYVAFLDSDDYVEPNMYEKLLTSCLEKNAEIACCGWVRVVQGVEEPVIKEDTHCSILEELEMTSEGAIHRMLLQKGMTYSACDKLFLRKFFQNHMFPVDRKPSEDLLCIFNIVKNANTIVHIGENTYNYRVVINSITQSKFNIEQQSHLRYTQEIQKIVNQDMPHLEKEALYAVVQASMHLYGRILECEEEVDRKVIKLKTSLEKEMRRNSLNILKNPYFTWKGRLGALLVGMKLYKAIAYLRK